MLNLNFILAVRRSEIRDYRTRIKVEGYKRTKGEKLFRSNHGWERIAFVEPTSDGKRWVLFSVYPESRQELKWIIDTFEAVVLGAWKWTGEELGTRWVHTEVLEMGDVFYPAVTERVWVSEPNPEDGGEWVVNILQAERTERELVDVGPTDLIGTPTFQIKLVKLQAFMPDIFDENGVNIGKQNVSAINRLAGQKPREGF